MAHVPFAFSVSHFINSVGADAGFASIIGLAILVLLYFAQARETSTLRGRADEAEQRAGALEARLAQVSRAQSAQPQPGVAQRPVSARPLVNPPAGVAQAPAAAAGTGAAPSVIGAPALAAAAVPSAPAGVGAPPLSSATRLIPLPSVAAPVAAGTAVAAAAPAASALATPNAVPAGGAPPSGTPSPVAAPAPATVAGAAQAGASQGAPATATAVFAGGNGPGAPTNGVRDHDDDEYSDEFAAVATHEPEPAPLPRVQLRPGGAGPVRPSQPASRRPSSPRGPSRLGRGFAFLLAALGVAAVAAVLLIVTSSGSNKSASTGSTATTNTPTSRHRTKPKAFAASSVSVGVLNGTAQAGLAAKVMNQLAGAGYKQGITPANASNQTETTTVVGYLPGQRTDAAHVAKALNLSSSAVQPIDSATQQLACPQASSCAVNVVVTVGQDLAGG